MVSFFGEVTTGVSRFLDDEEEDDLAGCQDYEFSLSQECPPCELLVIADGNLANTFVDMFVRGDTKEPMSTIEAKHPETDRSQAVAQIYGNEKVRVVLTPSVPATLVVFPLAEIFVGLVTSTGSVVVLTARHSSELRAGQGSGAGQGSAHSSHCLATSKVSRPLPCSTLPSPNILSGLPAAVVSLCQVRGAACVLLVTWSDVLSADSISLSGFLPMFKIKAVEDAGLKKPVDIAAKLKDSKKLVEIDDGLYM